jgi:hypothetical protein
MSGHVHITCRVCPTTTTTPSPFPQPQSISITDYCLRCDQQVDKIPHFRPDYEMAMEQFLSRERENPPEIFLSS